MMGGRRIKPQKHFRGEKSSQIHEEKIHQHLSKLLVKNGSDKRKGKKKLDYRAPAISPGWSYQPRLKGTL
jgi:hypothetical protein